MSPIKLSVSMIVKNEEERLPVSIPALDGFDEIVIYDTGSTDRTVEVARSLGTKVFTGEPIEPFHFAEARNRAAACCENRWLVSVDADEKFHPGAAEKIRKAVTLNQGRNVSGYRVRFKLASDTEYDRFIVFDRERWIWKNRVHNRLDPIGRAGNVLTIPDVTLEHFRSVERRPWREAQTFELLQIEVRENPKHHRAWYHLGIEYILRKQFKDAIRCLRKYLEHGPESDSDRYHTMFSIGHAHAELDQVEDALNWYLKATIVYPARRDAWWKATRLLIDKHRIPEAIRMLEKCIAIQRDPGPGDWLAFDEAWTDLPERTWKWYSERGFIERGSNVHV